ncbi:MAG: carboxypeptidase-like regulatory domain-containing protein [Planctomycetota bacterium]|nr:carboxypeptidase-like regulatory domain-containing protein [Planctomycetota bacterium]
MTATRKTTPVRLGLTVAVLLVVAGVLWQRWPDEHDRPTSNTPATEQIPSSGVSDSVELSAPERRPLDAGLSLTCVARIPELEAPGATVSVMITAENALTDELVVSGELPWSTRLDLSRFSGDLVVTAKSRHGLLDPPLSLRPPYAEKLQLILEPVGSLALTMTEWPFGEPGLADLRVLQEPAESIIEASGAGRVRFIQEPHPILFAHMSPGPYTVSLRHVPLDGARGAVETEDPGPGYSTVVEVRAGELSQVTLPAPIGAEGGIEAEAEPVRLRGQLLLGQAPVANARLSLALGYGSRDPATRTDESGFFALDISPRPAQPIRRFLSALPASAFEQVNGDHPSWARERWPVDIPASGDVFLELTLPGGGLTGLVTDARGQGVGGAAVRAWPRLDKAAVAEGTRDRLGLGLSRRFATTLSGPDGSYTLAGLRPGVYLVDAEGSSPLQVPAGKGGRSPNPGAWARVGTELAEVPTLVLEQGRAIAGRCVMADETSKASPPLMIMARKRAVSSDKNGARTLPGNGDNTWANWCWVADSSPAGDFEFFSSPNATLEIKALSRFDTPHVGARTLTLESGDNWNPTLPVVAAGRLQVTWLGSERRAHCFSIAVSTESGKPIGPTGAGRELRARQHTPWVAPGSYRLALLNEAGLVREEEVSIAAGTHKLVLID